MDARIERGITPLWLSRSLFFTYLSMFHLVALVRGMVSFITFELCCMYLAQFVYLEVAFRMGVGSVPRLLFAAKKVSLSGARQIRK